MVDVFDEPLPAPQRKAGRNQRASLSIASESGPQGFKNYLDFLNPLHYSTVPCHNISYNVAGG